ncbi:MULTISPECIES: type II toxin-antitoxin system RelE/ParE family toxin [Pseudomonas]|uniref:type II toxin-antitoxin system RelE/ParE family toxin n=1 Tax=Pseudomonas TaxID=286 RepID=UPI002265C77D|nr:MULTISPECIES: type II toxin-antitoxin system RelE/ParE family toxin [Pseudomonas]MCX5508412.1 type II toxin-antitoxin system RelE/ParE family toxin [Pseudomonas sp. BJa3]MDN4497984.1 type II toxin-antitoxin system RelE/ParE family toxin [Pseudomonas mosselii]
MIISFRCQETQVLYTTGSSRRWAPIQSVAQRKLTMLNEAVALKDLRAPPGNRLEALQGNRQGQYSIRINDQYRICFTWDAQGPENVEIVDYH